VRAEVAGFLAEICFDEGDHVPAGSLIGRLDVPDLHSRTLQKQAEVRESCARLQLLDIGPRPEEVDEQRLRVERMKAWRDLAAKDLEQARKAYKEELIRLDQQINQKRAELDSAIDAYTRAVNLRGRGAIAAEQLEEAERKHNVARAMLAQAEAQKRHREALGTREAIAGLDAEAELARREKDLADGESTLTLMEAGGRPEEVEAELARLARLQEEVRYLELMQKRLCVTSRAPGLIATPHLKEKLGQYVREGDLICQVEAPGALEVEITIAEEDVARVKPGQLVEFKARAAPFEVFTSKVVRVAPIAGKGDVHSTVTVYCALSRGAAELRPGMTGYARIYSEKRSVGAILLDRTLRFLRTEFWW
jgi:multidrug efflux pump subunit AcrA (membrane-fusion protein)